jgi:ubiquinone/menaquinone biosynthesis C-methylase UbiE
LVLALNEAGVQYISGIEPYAPALNIAKAKAAFLGLEQSSFQEASAENLPYHDGDFDFIHCFSVLEHVQDVRKSIREMHRVLRQGGLLYIHTPNYAWPYEGHYKVPAPTFMPFGKLLTKLWLRMLGRPTSYLESINLYSSRELNNILKKEVGLFYRIFSWEYRTRQIPADGSLKSMLVKSLFSFFDNWLDVYPFQEIVVVKQ